MGDLVEMIIEHPATGGETTRSTSALCLVQATNGFFEVSTPVHQGDWVVIPDPRGGTERRYAAKVKINNSPGMSSLSHIAVAWGDPPTADTVPATTVFHGPYIQVTGSGATQIAWGDKVEQHQSTHVTQGFEELAHVIAEVLAALPRAELAPEDVSLAEDEGKRVLEEATKATPDVGVIRRGIATIKGVLAPVAAGLTTGIAAGTADLAKELIQQLGSIGGLS